MSTRTIDNLGDLVALVGEPSARASDQGRDALAHVVDERTVVIAERPGNRRVDGYRNVPADQVAAEEVFSPCSKAFLRPGLWDSATWDPEGRVPRRAVLTHAPGPDERSLEELDADDGPCYAEGPYS